MKRFCLVAVVSLPMLTLMSCMGSADGSCTEGSCPASSIQVSDEAFDDVALLQTHLQHGDAVDVNSKRPPKSLPEDADSASMSTSKTHHEDLPTFASFLATHGRTYSPGSEEYEMRRAIFEMRVAEVRRHNSRTDRRWSAAVNHLSDRTKEELDQLKGLRPIARRGSGRAHSPSSMLSLNQSVSKQVDVPESYTWSQLSAIKKNVDQGDCGSCWAEATTTMMNAADEIAGPGRSFSVQDLVDCVPNPHNCGGSGGCDGATVELAMNWIAQNGFRTEEKSPYFGYDRPCMVSLLQSGAVVPKKSKTDYDAELEAMIATGVHNVAAGSAGYNLGLRSWTRLPENEYWPLLVNLVQYGPLAISVDADNWFSYGGGIFDGCNQEKPVINHAVVLFGYGVDSGSGLKFWDAKNSWGIGWGVDGNIRMLREDTITCGIDEHPEFGTACDGGPSEVTVCGTCGILYDVVSVAMR